MIRRREFAETDPAVARDVLEGARYGHLATVAPDGLPEVRPLNYALVGDHVYVHCAGQGQLAARAGTGGVLSAVDAAAWLPSHWQDPQMACGATTWYRSVQVRGTLRAVDSVAEKASAFGAFMRRYQPEGGHVDLHDPCYLAPLERLTVLALPLEGFTCKVKVGQHLPEAVRAAMAAHLEARGWHDDWTILRLTERANGTPAAYPAHSSGLRWSDDPADVDPAALHAMLRDTYWAAARTRDVVDENLRRSTLTLSAHSADRLVAHARVTVSNPKVAWLFDVLVSETLQNRGIGTTLMRRVLEHRSLRHVRRVFLDTRDAMAFYARFGFEELRRDEARQSSLMVLERSPSECG